MALCLLAAAEAASAAEPISPLPTAVALDQVKVRLGEQLFHDVRLSRDGRVSCASCHGLEQGGDDGQKLPTGADGRPLDFNAPTVFNVGLSYRLNWRGNFRSLEEQAEAVLLDPQLMNITWDELLPRLNADLGYRQAFADGFGGKPDRQSVLDALAIYERSLITPDAPFDRYLQGDRAALSLKEQRGYELFKAYGCIACHQGMAVGANLLQPFGIFADPFAGGEQKSADLGRYALTGSAADRHVFRVPGLRNVAVTAPYFHDGRTRSLEQAVAIMGRSQLGRSLSAYEVQRIAAFLRTLTGRYRGRLLQATDHDPP